MIDLETRDAMREKLRLHLPKKDLDIAGHRWRTNRHGARSRALFCLRMASLCE